MLITARAERLLGRAMLARNEPADACVHLAATQAQFTLLEMPLEVARTRMVLALALSVEQPEPAVAEARIALTVFEDLGASRALMRLPPGCDRQVRPRRESDRRASAS